MQTNQDSETFAKGMAMLCLNFNRELTDQLIELYWIVLQDLPVDAFKLAVKRALRESKSMPRVAELLSFAGLSESSESRAVAAWNDVQRALSLGPYKHIDFQDKLANAAIRSLGGWPNFLARFGSAEDEKWARHEFIKAYNNFSSGVSEEACAALPGLAERSVVAGQICACIPVQVGCTPDRAALPNYSNRSSNPLSIENKLPRNQPSAFLADLSSVAAGGAS